MEQLIAVIAFAGIILSIGAGGRGSCARAEIGRSEQQPAIAGG